MLLWQFLSLQKLPAVKATKKELKSSKYLWCACTVCILTTIVYVFLGLWAQAGEVHTGCSDLRHAGRCCFCHHQGKTKLKCGLAGKWGYVIDLRLSNSEVHGFVNLALVWSFCLLCEEKKWIVKEILKKKKNFLQACLYYCRVLHNSILYINIYFKVFFFFTQEAKLCDRFVR